MSILLTPTIFLDELSFCGLPKFPSQPKTIEPSDNDDNKIIEQYLPDTIEPNTFLSEKPHILFRTVADPVNSYNIFDIIKRIKCDENNFRENLIKEIALNSTLKRQLSKNKIFTGWVTESKKYVVSKQLIAKL